MNNKQLAEHILGTLRGLLSTDSECLGQLIEYRVPCSDSIRGHPTAVPTGTDTGLEMGLLGVINALMPTDYVIVACFSDGALTGFECRKR